MKHHPRSAAFTLMELMLAVGVGVIALVAAFSGFISIQRCIKAGEEFAADKAEQTRLNDYLALDLRRALTVQGPVGNVLLTLTLPDFYDTDGKARTPIVTKAPDSTYVTKYGTTPITVVYRKDGNTITREEGDEDPEVIATNVADFECPVDNIGVDKFVHTRISFLPSFQQNGTPSATTRAATTVYNTIRLRNK